MQVATHDAATNFCSWLPKIWPSCSDWLAPWFDEWGFVGPLVLVIAGIGLGLRAAIKLIAADSPPLGYLRDEDTELGAAIRDMVWGSAWGKWFAAQSLADRAPRSINEQFLMGTATSLVLNALTDGRLEVRGRKLGQLDYEAIPQTHWRSTALHMIPDNRSLWKMVLIPRGGAEITPDGKVIGRDKKAVQRTDQLATYDSLIVNSRQFEQLWPGKDRKIDTARKRLLKKAKKAGADPDEIKNWPNALTKYGLPPRSAMK
jgi:hypothetical protein